ncbi:diguanylate cyclase domain-containing protein [Singulisphaera sp. GP187]|uniref:diguanylate cyclase domain-containing protein n=1 Tax=Singulisphaera sp. GP187 TaxID=1882752 RepID=UPI0009F974FA|nr:diguanylate cyclase [Singulisphaera sp. GP187]
MAETQLNPPTTTEGGWAAPLERMIPTVDSESGPAPIAILHESDHTRVLRLTLPNRSPDRLIVKEMFGPRAKARWRHERGILERLAGVCGVPQLAPSAEYANANALAMEDMAGVSLAEAIRVGRMTMPELVEFAVGLTRIVAALHRRRVVHKDINPANILLAGPGRRPLLIDFDLATTFAEERPGFVHHREISGTLAYLAPEQTGRTGRAVDRRADLYSLGATLYELAVGQPPFVGTDPLQLIRDHLVRVPTPPAERNPLVPRALSEIIMRLLEKEPDRRYQCAEGLADDLARLREIQTRGEDGTFPLGERDFPIRLSPPSRLIGREPEIEALRKAFEGIGDDRARGVLISGAPGVGKTVLIDELRPMVTARRGLFVAGKFEQYHRDATTGAVSQALHALGRLLLAEPERELVDHRARILHALGPNAGMITAVVPEFALLLGAEPEISPGDPVEAEARLRQAVLELLRAVASPARPVVMVLDGLQWAGPTTIRFLDAVLADETLRGVLIVGAYRDAEVEAAHPLAPMLSRWERLDVAPLRLRLENLPLADLGTLLEEMLRLRPSEAIRLAAVIGDRTGGNPYDTVELVNALRQDGALILGPEGWGWNEATVRRFVGRSEVVDLLAARIDRLPVESAELLETMACLAGEVGLDLLEAASGLTASALEARLAPPLEDGLLVLDHGDPSLIFERTGAVRFRHDRVQQAAYRRLDPSERLAVHLDLARRLVTFPNHSIDAADQYLPAVEAIHDPDERRRVAGLFREAAARARLVSNHVTSDHFLEAAMVMLGPLGSVADQDTLADLEFERHAALSSLGCLDEADSLYRSIERRGHDPVDLAKATCVQIGSLSHRGRSREALELGLDLLRRLGARTVGPNVEADLAQGADAFWRWAGADASRDERTWSETYDPRVFAIARLINRMMPAAYFCDRMLQAWLVLEGQRLWVEHGPCPPLICPLGHASLVTFLLRGDYRAGYQAVRHVLAVGEALGFQTETAQARFLFAIHNAHWFEPLENDLQYAHQAREDLMQGGDLQFACFTYVPAIWTLFECGPTLDRHAAEIESAIALAERIGNVQSLAGFVTSRQMSRSLRGETDAPGVFSGPSFDEAEHLASMVRNPVSTCYFHVSRALSAALFNDEPELARQAALAVSMLANIEGAYAVALVHWLQALAWANRARTAQPEARAASLVELDECRDWLARRAADAPGNFLHMLRLVEAERAWAVGDFQGAASAFDAAQHEVSTRQRPWHRAFIAERAARFHLAHGLEHAGGKLLAKARRLYGAWGATAKVRELEQNYPFLRTVDSPRKQGDSPGSSGVSADAIDMLAILRASQTLSSETSLDRIKTRVGELLGAMTGATKVLVVLRDDDSEGWCLPSAGEDGGPIPVDEAGTRGLLPLSAFHYAERTREPLLVEDATRDDRFARDPYIAALDCCSLLLVPISSQGVLRAILMLENRLSRGAFSASGMDAVMLIAGQLAVSLDNARLYASLERKVADRTEALGAANRRLEALSVTDSLTGLANRRRFDEVLAAEWQRAERSRISLGAAMIDIDHFKLYNDRYGHLAGDACLRRVAEALEGSIRQGTDWVARYGGEEFALILPDANIAITREVAERACTAVAALRIPHEGAARGIVTVSIGIAAIAPSPWATAEQLLEAADVALYQAKNNGRNQVAS